MQSGSQRVTSELNTTISDPSDGDRLRIDCLEIAYNQLKPVCMGSLPGAEAFDYNLIFHDSGEAGSET